MLTKQKPKGSVVLKVIIVALVGLLVYTLWEPYAIVRKDEMLQNESRLRMSNLRNAQMFYFEMYNSYIDDLDSLISWIKNDSLVIEKKDSLFEPLTDGLFIPESLKYSPRTRQEYIIKVDDTSATKRYYIEDPDGYGSVSSLSDLNLLHRGSWEH